MTNAAFTLTRRRLVGSGLAAAAASSFSSALSAKEMIMSGTEPFRTNDPGLALSFSLMVEAGGQPISGADG
jgi:hypothetical protein